MRRSGRVGAGVVAAVSGSSGQAPGPAAKAVAPPAASKREASTEPSRPKRQKSVKTADPSSTAQAATASRQYEVKWWDKGFARVAGVDEAGRGPLAGPVVAAACVMPATVQIDGINDSKQIGEEEREAIYEALTSHPEVEWAACVIDHGTIDEINILQATMRAMEGAVAKLPNGCDRCLVDGPRVPLGLQERGEPLVKGDSKSYIIGAASIIAKVTRDRIMREAAKTYPQYGFLNHKGYGTPEHMALVRQHGPCAIHRRSFEPIKSMTGWVRPPKGGEGGAAAAAAAGGGKRKAAGGKAGKGAGSAATTEGAAAAKKPRGGAEKKGGKASEERADV